MTVPHCSCLGNLAGQNNIFASVTDSHPCFPAAPEGCPEELRLDEGAAAVPGQEAAQWPGTPLPSPPVSARLRSPALFPKSEQPISQTQPKSCPWKKTNVSLLNEEADYKPRPPGSPIPPRRGPCQFSRQQEQHGKQLVPPSLLPVHVPSGALAHRRSKASMEVPL